VSQLALSKDGLLLASGGTDSNVRIWDLEHQTCTHNLRGAQGVIRFGICLCSLITVVLFKQGENRLP